MYRFFFQRVNPFYLFVEIFKAFLADGAVVLSELASILSGNGVQRLKTESDQEMERFQIFLKGLEKIIESVMSVQFH